MISINNDFIGYHSPEHNVNFSGSDSRELYHKNLKLQPDDWYYRTASVSYVRNSNGHRCKEIKDIDLNNYILFAGCSHSEGIGLELENTYPYLLSNKLKCDYYNLSVGGTGIDILNYNLVTWFAKIKQPPKLLIVQWPDPVRVTVYKSNKWYNYGMWSINNCTADRNNIGNFFISGDNIGFFKTTKILTKRIIYNIAKCPIIEVTPHHQTMHDDKEHILKRLDSARDIQDNICHFGIKSNFTNSIMLYQKAIELINT